jgi:hypothetical protein
MFCNFRNDFMGTQIKDAGGVAMFSFGKKVNLVLVVKGAKRSKVLDEATIRGVNVMTVEEFASEHGFLMHETLIQKPFIQKPLIQKQIEESKPTIALAPSVLDVLRRHQAMGFLPMQWAI